MTPPESLIITVHTFTADDNEVLLLTLPTITAATPNLILMNSRLSLQKFRVRATYTGICSYEVYVRAVNTAVPAVLSDTTMHTVLNTLSIQDDSTVHLLGDAILRVANALGTHSQVVKNNGTLEVIG